MTRFTALALRPVVYILDVGIALTGAQTFREARAVTREKLANILNREAQDKMPGGTIDSHKNGLDISNRNYRHNI